VHTAADHRAQQETGRAGPVVRALGTVFCHAPTKLAEDEGTDVAIHVMFSKIPLEGGQASGKSSKQLLVFAGLLDVRVKTCELHMEDARAESSANQACDQVQTLT